MELWHPCVWNIGNLPHGLPGVPGLGGTLLSCSAGQGAGLAGRDCFLQPSVLGGTRVGSSPSMLFSVMQGQARYWPSLPKIL